ncbi:fyve domain containing protein [Sporothrix brasiliensis 5110]|uniref:Fyve domain containing protein n=1 Tax=Sporothrix brasiliensis 5110 TaxID=1398154 RepID=A0A0C2J5E4_9PEZI|nr:fyve domain containing protein [Sporothrix brasiliensis 5110]KIH94200.1 fyve domain containing protein [Sporothrix brasiliensis 5110]
MAADFIMPRIPTASRDAFYTQPHQRHAQEQIPAFNQQHYAYAAVAAANTAATASNLASQYNPQISPLSTSNSSSPTSPKPASSNNTSGNYHTRQVRPLYIPAVLRRNEHPSREGQAKAGDAPDHSSGDSSAVGDGSEDDDEQDDHSQTSRRSGGMRSSGSFISLPGLGAFGIGLLSRRSTNDSGKCVDTKWNLDQFPDVNGFPSRSHWKPDPESTMCDEPTCKKSFSYFTRRHHCRRCGNIFCDFHSAFEIPLDEQANYNPKGSSNRACAYCFREFKAWRTRTNSSDLSSASSGTTTPATVNTSAYKKAATAPTSPVVALRQPGAPGTPTVAKVPDVAQSVPGDWNWSTF